MMVGLLKGKKKGTGIFDYVFILAHWNNIYHMKKVTDT